MTDEMWIVIPRWDEFQHRDMARSTVPPWIKNLTRLLSDEAYLKLSGHRRAILHGLWLEYARTRRAIAKDTASLSRRLALKVITPDLDALNHAGFVTFSASKPASKVASEHASLEVEVEREGLTKTPKSAREPDRTAFLIRTMIANGALTTLIDLEAELSHHPTLTDAHREALRSVLTPTNGNGAGDETHPETEPEADEKPPAAAEPEVVW